MSLWYVDSKFFGIFDPKDWSESVLFTKIEKLDDTLKTLLHVQLEFVFHGNVFGDMASKYLEMINMLQH